MSKVKEFQQGGIVPIGDRSRGVVQPNTPSPLGQFDGIGNVLPDNSGTISLVNDLFNQELSFQKELRIRDKQSNQAAKDLFALTENLVGTGKNSRSDIGLYPEYNQLNRDIINEASQIKSDYTKEITQAYQSGDYNSAYRLASEMRERVSNINGYREALGFQAQFESFQEDAKKLRSRGELNDEEYGGIVDQFFRLGAIKDDGSKSTMNPQDFFTSDIKIPEKADLSSNSSIFGTRFAELGKLAGKRGSEGDLAYEQLRTNALGLIESDPTLKRSIEILQKREGLSRDEAVSFLTNELVENALTKGSKIKDPKPDKSNSSSSGGGKGDSDKDGSEFDLFNGTAIDTQSANSVLKNTIDEYNLDSNNPEHVRIVEELKVVAGTEIQKNPSDNNLSKLVTNAVNSKARELLGVKVEKPQIPTVTIGDKDVRIVSSNRSKSKSDIVVTGSYKGQKGVITNNKDLAQSNGGVKTDEANADDLRSSGNLNLDEGLAIKNKTKEYWFIPLEGVNSSQSNSQPPHLR